MPSIKDKSTVNALAGAFCGNGRKQEQAMKDVGYTPAYANSYCGKMWENTRLQAAIARIDAKTAEKMEHTRDTAVKLLNESLAALTAKVKAGEVGAIAARTAIIRELNAISNLHSATVHTPAALPRALTPEENKLLEDFARTYKLRLSKEIA